MNRHYLSTRTLSLLPNSRAVIAGAVRIFHVMYRQNSRLLAFMLAMATLSAIQGQNRALANYVYTTVDDPHATNGTYVEGISGNTVVGYYQVGTVRFGFSETGGVFTTLSEPSAREFLPGNGTVVTGISGNTVVGSYTDGSGLYHGFSETGGVYQTLDNPTAFQTVVLGISGNTVFGYYTTSAQSASHGFSEVGGIYTTLDDPAAAYGNNQGGVGTYAYGMSGNTVVGSYIARATDFQGFIETGGVYTTLDDPSATQITMAVAISGNTVFGSFVNGTGTHGFSEVGGVYTTLDDPKASSGQPLIGTHINGASGDTFVGFYNVGFANNGTGDHGFIATLDTVPEAASLSVLGLGVAGILWRRHRRVSQ